MVTMDATMVASTDAAMVASTDAAMVATVAGNGNLARILR